MSVNNISFGEDLREILNPEQNYFYKDTRETSNRIIQDESVFDAKISRSDNVATMSVIDTEYQDYVGVEASIAKISEDEKFVDRGNYVNLFNNLRADLEEKNSINILHFIRSPSFYKHLLIKDGSGDIDYDLILDAIGNDLKLSSSFLISAQIKNALSNENGQIFLSPVANHIREEYRRLYHDKAKDFRDYPVMSSGCVLIDELASKGVKSSIERFDDYDLYKEKSHGLKTHKINFVTFYGIADILKIFPDEELRGDIKNLIKRGKLTHDKRLKSVDYVEEPNSDIRKYTGGAILPWIITHNGISYKVKLGIIDLTAMHGITSLNDLYINTGIENGYKKSLDGYKSRMIEALLFEPELYHEYALGDIRLYEALLAYNEKLREMYRILGIESYFKELKLTIGGTVYGIVESKMFQLTGISAFERDNMKKEELEAFYADHTLLGSPKYLQEYSLEHNLTLFNGNTRSYNRYLLSKCDGGRCYCNIPCLPKFSKDYTLCDIDISGAYTSIMSNLFCYVGSPCIRIFPRQDSITLREFIKKYRKELRDDNYYMRVEGKLKYEQDLIVSFMDSSKGVKWFKHKRKNDRGEDEVYKSLKHDLESTKNKILTMEIEDGAITPQILEVILKEFSPRQRDDFLDNILVKAFIFYPPSMELSSPEEYEEKLAEHEAGIINGTYEFDEKYSDREIMRPFNYFFKIDYGTYLIDTIRTARSIYKKQKIKSLDLLFKLIGNTSYGVNVSKYFAMSNIVFANNITGAVRCCIYYTEKALNLIQTITDGGIFDVNKVPHPVYKKLDSLAFVRGYQLSNRELANNNKWTLKPISRNKKPIVYNEETKLWLVDDEYYDEEGYKKIIAKLALEHIQECFPSNNLMNKIVRQLKTDEEGFVITKEDGTTPEYTTRKGNFSFEVKDFLREASFTGQSNYNYVNYKGESKTINRSYETKKDSEGYLLKTHTAFFLDGEGLLILDESFYKKESPSEIVFEALKKDPSKVPLMPPFAISIIIKTKDWVQSYNKTYKYTNLNSGDTSYKLVVKQLFEISRFKFKTNEQYSLWQKATDRLKNKYGLTFELFFINDDGTCNVQMMNDVIDNMITQGVIDPLKGDKELDIKGFDIHRHLSRNMKPSTKRYLDTIKQARRYQRLMLVGKTQFIMEYSKMRDKKQGAVIYEDELDNYDTNKYSQVYEYVHHELPII